MEGVMRESENPSSFVPANIPAKGEWYWLDVPGMARAAGLPSDAPMMEVPTLCACLATMCLVSWPVLGFTSKADKDPSSHCAAFCMINEVLMLWHGQQSKGQPGAAYDRLGAACRGHLAAGLNLLQVSRTMGGESPQATSPAVMVGQMRSSSAAAHVAILHKLLRRR